MRAAKKKLKFFEGVFFLFFPIVFLLCFLPGLFGLSSAEGVLPGIPGCAEPPAPSHYYVTQDGAGGESGSDWDNALGEVAFIAKLKTAVDGDIFWIAQGVYRPVTPVNSDSITDLEKAASFVLKNGVKLYGGFQGDETDLADRDWQNYPTVLTGDLAGDDANKVNGATVDAGDIEEDNSNTVICVDGAVDDTALLDGFTVCGGNKGTLFEGVFCGGGMYNNNGSPTVTNCTFSGNNADTNGGGMYNSVGNPMVTNCTFSSNTAVDGGGMYNSVGSPTVTNCTFSDNLADTNGGGMYNSSGILIVTNCTFSDNSVVVVEGWGMYNNSEEQQPAVVNCIFWGNAGKPIVGSVAVVYSVVYGGCDGTENIDDDPLLGPLQDNGGPTWTCALGAGSSALDTGIAIEGMNADQRGISRPQNSGFDIGAVEVEWSLITAAAGTGGTIDPEGNVAVSHGGNQTFAITPAGGYQVEDVVVDEISQGALADYEFTNVTADHIITASFAAVPTLAPAPKPDPGPPTSTPVPTAVPTTAPTPMPTAVPSPSQAPFPTSNPDVPLPNVTFTITLGGGGGEILSGPLAISLTPELLQFLLLDQWMSPEEFESLFAEGYNSTIFSLFSLAARLEDEVPVLTLMIEISVEGGSQDSDYRIYLLGATWDSQGNPLGFTLLADGPESPDSSESFEAAAYPPCGQESAGIWRLDIPDNGSADRDLRMGYVDAEIGGVVVSYPQKTTPIPTISSVPIGGGSGGCALGAAPVFLLLLLVPLLLRK